MRPGTTANCFQSKITNVISMDDVTELRYLLYYILRDNTKMISKRMIYGMLNRGREFIGLWNVIQGFQQGLHFITAIQATLSKSLLCST